MKSLSVFPMWKLGQNGEKNWFGDLCTFLVAEETHVQLPAFPRAALASHWHVMQGKQLAGMTPCPDFLSSQQSLASPGGGAELGFGVCSSPEVFRRLGLMKIIFFFSAL